MSELYMDLEQIVVPAELIISPQLVVRDGDFEVDVTRIAIYITDTEGNRVEIESCVAPVEVLDSVTPSQ